MGNLDQPSEFIDSQGSPVVAPIFLGVESGHSRQGVGPGSTALPAPFRECPDRGPMVVDGLKRQPLVTKGLQSLLNAIMGQAGQSVDPGHGSNTAGSVGGQVHMLFGCPLGDQACPVLREMVVQGARNGRSG